jgi:hypothetical protein
MPRLFPCDTRRRLATLRSLKSSASLLPQSDQSSESLKASWLKLRTLAAESPSLTACLNTVDSSTGDASDMAHEHLMAARLIALEEDKAEMLELFQKIYDAIAQDDNAFQAKSLAYVALQRYGQK